MDGDFNEIRFIKERKGEDVVDKFMRVFSEFVDNHAMVDLPMVGNDFTWSRGEASPSFSRIDRFFYLRGMGNGFPQSYDVCIA